MVRLLVTGGAGFIGARCSALALESGHELTVLDDLSTGLQVRLDGLAEAGARIAPPVPAWYHQPETLQEMVDFMVLRTLDLFGYDLAPLQRWEGPISDSPQRP